MKKMLTQRHLPRSLKVVEIARRRLIAIEDRKWDRSFARSQDVLEQLGNEALAEHRAGRTRPIDPDQM